MRFLRQSLTGLFLLCLTLALVAWAGLLIVQAVQERISAEPRVPQARERVFAVNVVTAETGTIVPELTAFGEVQSRRTLQLRASAGGVIVDLAEGFEDGGRVEAGQVLARIDPSQAEAALARADNDVTDAEAETRDAARALDLARDTLTAAEEQAALRDRAFRRQTDLRDRGVTTEAVVEESELAAASSRQAVLSARAALTQAEARVDQAATALARAEIARSEAQRDLDDTTITAEFAGTLSDVTAVEGGLVSQNEQLAQLIDPDALEVTFRVSTAQYARLLDEDGRLRTAPVTVTLDIQGVPLQAQGTISRDSAAVGEGQVGRLIYARLDRPRGMKPGDFVTVTTEEPPLEDVARLPANAIDAAGTVLVIGAEDRLEAMAVALERRQGDDILVSAPGLDGRDVVRERTPLLGPGIKVRALRPPVPQTAQAAGADTPDSDGASPVAATPAAAEGDDTVELSQERRDRIRAWIEASPRMPDDMKTRILAALDQPRVPARMVERIESRMGG